MSLITLSDIQDGGAQMRVEMKPEIIHEYADDMAAGATFPPVVVLPRRHRLLACRWLPPG